MSNIGVGAILKNLIIHCKTLVSHNDNMGNEISNVASGWLPLPYYYVLC
jgi:hypothetical protein